MGPIEAIERLRRPMSLDSAGLMQQSICYDRRRRWTVSVSWGFSVQIIRGFIKARDMEIPGRTMLNWYRTYDENGYPFNTRPFFEHKCQKPFVYYLSNAVFYSKTNKTITEYISDRARSPKCEWKMANPFRIQKVVVHKRPDPNLWDKNGKYCGKFVWDDEIHRICGNMNNMETEMLVNEMASLNNIVRELNSNMKGLLKITIEEQQHYRKSDYDWGLLVEAPGSIAAARREQVAIMQEQRRMKIAHYEEQSLPSMKGRLFHFLILHLQVLAAENRKDVVS
ncbi:hypothetical protein FEM48_Zijuj01G0030600 [Ziziphus jujuba var. spinosa]|uniref:Uncharacterized protein n=1 Tax=Ziziphus jujuba var. spinosa TaxID=714518 RepID=A0A978VYS4_ZIZJJ|nr:hypothetical protein FEM48_Zijuj01G0030600 [Ziziphus jujuba var. spinosa]